MPSSIVYFGAVVTAGHPVRILAHKECDGRDTAGDNAAAALTVFVEHRRMRGQAAPSRNAGPSLDDVRDRRIVVGNATL